MNVFMRLRACVFCSGQIKLMCRALRLFSQPLVDFITIHTSLPETDQKASAILKKKGGFQKPGQRVSRPRRLKHRNGSGETGSSVGFGLQTDKRLDLLANTPLDERCHAPFYLQPGES